MAQVKVDNTYGNLLCILNIQIYTNNMQIIYSLYRATKIAKKSMQQHNVFNPEWILYLGILKKVKSMIFIGNYSTF